MEFQRGTDVKKSLRVGESIFQKLRKHEICITMNTPDGTEIDRNGQGQIWINPNNQTCFHSEWCTESDLDDWMNGTGIMVRGENQEEQAKFWEMANWVAKTDRAWSIGYNFKYFDLFDIESSQPAYVQRYDKNPGLTHIKSKPQETLAKIYGRQVIVFSKELSYFMDEPEEFDKFFWRKQKEMNDVLWGVSQTMIMLGVGFSAACNTPCMIENHAWDKGLVISYGLYLYYKNKGMKFPDFKFIYGDNK